MKMRKPTPAIDYDDAFYDCYLDASCRSARKYAGRLATLFTPASVVDLGCGRGGWLKAFREVGAERTLGLDGDWNRQGDMIDPAIEFRAVDLNRPVRLPQDERFDLALSLEVAEHLEPSAARTFVGSLAALSDVVIFGAAFTGQGGTHHLNEQRPSYWAALFAGLGYRPYDAFRPVFWGDPEIDYWYRQNTFLYVRSQSPASAVIAPQLEPIGNIAFMDCVHPDLFFATLGRTRLAPALRQAAKAMVPDALRPFARRLARVRPGRA